MDSESARMHGAAQHAFRVPYPNARARQIVVVALDAPSQKRLAALAAEEWAEARFIADPFAAAGAPMLAGDGLRQWGQDIAQHAGWLIGEIGQADLLVMLAALGQDASGAAQLAEICRMRHIRTSAFILADAATDDAALSASLRQIRPHAATLTVAQDLGAVSGLLHALRA